MGKTNTKVLNLDELELDESDVTIVDKGVEHKMAILTVDKFIEHQRRADEQQRAIDAGEASDEEGMARIFEIMRDSIGEFFPTLDVGSISSAKMFRIFAFLNEMTAKANEAAEEVDAEDAEGNEDSTEGQTES